MLCVVTWCALYTLCRWLLHGFCNFTMELESATNVVKEEHLPVVETDDSCLFKYFEIVPLATDTDGSCSTECVSGDWSAEVKQEDMAVVKQEPDDVCWATLYSVYYCRKNVVLEPSCVIFLELFQWASNYYNFFMCQHLLIYFAIKLLDTDYMVIIFIAFWIKNK